MHRYIQSHIAVYLWLNNPLGSFCGYLLTAKRPNASSRHKYMILVAFFMPHSTPAIWDRNIVNPVVNKPIAILPCPPEVLGLIDHRGIYAIMSSYTLNCHRRESKRAKYTSTRFSSMGELSISQTFPSLEINDMQQPNYEYCGMMAEFWDLFRGDTSSWGDRFFYKEVVAQSGNRCSM